MPRNFVPNISHGRRACEGDDALDEQESGVWRPGGHAHRARREDTLLVVSESFTNLFPESFTALYFGILYNPVRF